MRTARAPRSVGRTLSSIGSDAEDHATGTRQDSLRSSHTGSFLDREPVFDSGGSSDSESDYAPSKPARQPVSVIWQDITIVRSFRTPSEKNPTRQLRFIWKCYYQRRDEVVSMRLLVFLACWQAVQKPLMSKVTLPPAVDCGLWQCLHAGWEDHEQTA